ncbi:hypothetical protein F5B21DRAFT_514322 [Xylaria acuta]|nr:hypothetical protein F5B21DRAFT_514322 [Xylaria acuta]
MASIHTPIIETTNLFVYEDLSERPYKNEIWSDCKPYSAQSGSYSPGICPSGQEFEDVIKIDHGNESGTNILYIGYCWSILYTDPPQCVSSFEPPVTALIPDPIGGNPNFPLTTVLNSTVIAVGTYLAMWWRKSDLSSFPESLAASLRVGMGLPAFTTTPMTIHPTESSSAPASNVTGPQDSAAHISKGVIAGISTGVAVAVLLIGTLGYLALSRRWKKPRLEAEQQAKISSARRTNNSRWLHRIMRWKKAPLPDLPEMDQGQNIYKYFRGNTQSDDNSQVNRGYSSTAVVGDRIELEGSIPVCQETVPEAVSEASQEQQ